MARLLSTILLLGCLLATTAVAENATETVAKEPELEIPSCNQRAGVHSLGKTTLVASTMATKDTVATSQPADMAKGYSTVILAVKPTEMNDDVRQFEKSCNTHNMPVMWMNSYSFPDTEAMATMNIKPESVVLFLENVADMVMVGSPEAMKATLKQSGKNVMMGVQFSCRFACGMNWPKKANKHVFANPEMMVGYASSMLALFTEAAKREGVTNQDRVASVFLDETFRTTLKMEMDYDMTMMMSLEMMPREMSLAGLSITTENDQVRLLQAGTNFMPAIIRADGNFMLRNQIGNYMVGPMEMADPQTMTNNKLFMMLFVEDISPFMELVLKSLSSMTFPKANMVIECFIDPRSTNYIKNKAILSAWVAENHNSYAGMNMRDIMTTRESMVAAMTEAANWGADYFMFMDTLSRLTENSTMQQLMALNQSIVAPLLSRSGRLWSNFWGAMADEMDMAECRDMHPSCGEWSLENKCSTTGTTCMQSCRTCPTPNFIDMEYVSAVDYRDMVEGTIKGVWAVPMVFGAMMMKADMLPKVAEALNMLPDDSLPTWRVEIMISRFMQQRYNTHVNVANNMFYGRYINIDSYVPKTHADLWMMMENPEEWEEKYIHPQYDSYREVGFVPNCNDVYRIPIFSPQFCKDLIAECEEFGSWSGGAYSDPRLAGGFEPVPTDDIHLRQLGLDGVWYNIITTYVRPVAAYHYIGYHLEGKQTLDFVVKYHPARQAALRVHHDASTLTLNVALNQGGVEYQGGGTHFTRQNCTLRDNPPGWGSLSPGRLTHQHEGLRTTEGTRYILVSFIDQ